MREIAPCACVIANDKEDHIKIELQLPGVDKKDVSVEMKKDSFCISARRGEELEYSGCYALPYEVESGREEIGFENGLLRVSVPISRGMEQKTIYRPLA